MALVNGGWRAKIIADSISQSGFRLTTMEVTFPRSVLAEFNTHRMLSKNSASSRAIPVEKMIKMVEDNPFIPTYWGANQKGMQAKEEIDPSSRGGALIEWELAKRDAVRHAYNLHALGVHKQTVNRILEPFMWHTVIVTATEWSNFLALRTHEAAAPEIRNIALLMEQLLKDNSPKFVQNSSWHLPLIDEEDWEILNSEPYSNQAQTKKAIEISVARCARVSYLTHDNKRDHKADRELFTRLLTSRHMSPFEHVAQPMWNASKGMWSGNFQGWNQFRKSIPQEHDASLITVAQK